MEYYSASKRKKILTHTPTWMKPEDTESESEVAQSCPTLCDPMDCSLPGSSVHGIFQATILGWIAISFSRASFQPGIKPTSPALTRGFFITEPPAKS